MNEMAATVKQDDDALLNGLMALGQMIERRIDEALAPHGLSLPKMLALHSLAHADEPVVLGVLSQQLHCVRSNITQLVDRLEADKLVQRVPDVEDRRSVRAAITEAGRQCYEMGWRTMEEVKQEVLRGLSTSDREQMLSLLTRLYEGQGA